MNLFDILEAHHKAETGQNVGVDTMNSYMKQAERKPIAIRYGELDIDHVHTAVLLAYAGNINKCLSDSQYTRLYDILREARAGLVASVKTEPMTKNITKYVLNAGGYAA